MKAFVALVLLVIVSWVLLQLVLLPLPLVGGALGWLATLGCASLGFILLSNWRRSSWLMRQAGETVYVNFYDDITAAKVKTLMARIAEALEKSRPETLYLCMSSPGGSVAAGFTLYNFLKGLPVNLVTHNTGSVDSIATIIFLAGRERYATPSASFLFHGVQTTLAQATSYSIFELREFLSNMEQDHTRIVHVITHCTRLEEAEVRELFKQGEAKGPAFAEKMGIIHAVRDLSIPPGAKLLSPALP